MGKKKRLKYSTAKTLSNILQPEILDFKDFTLKSKWSINHFNNTNDTIVEIGCGKGEYTVNLAKKYPDKNFIGVDIKSDRMLHGAKTALDEGLPNVCFVRLRVEFLASFFPENMFSEGWITFPDPYASSLNGKRRLTSGRFLEIYRKVFKKGSSLHLKTDNDTLYNFTKESIVENSARLIDYTDDLHGKLNGTANGDARSILTTYEKRYLAQSMKIKYVLFSL